MIPQRTQAALGAGFTPGDSKPGRPAEHVPLCSLLTGAGGEARGCRGSRAIVQVRGALDVLAFHAQRPD